MLKIENINNIQFSMIVHENCYIIFDRIEAVRCDYKIVFSLFRGILLKSRGIITIHRKIIADEYIDIVIESKSISGGPGVWNRDTEHISNLKTIKGFLELIGHRYWGPGADIEIRDYATTT